MSFSNQVSDERSIKGLLTKVWAGSRDTGRESAMPWRMRRGYCIYACKDKRMKDHLNLEGKNLGERFKRSCGLQLRDTVILM